MKGAFSDQELVGWGRKALEQESQALNDTAQQLGQEFSQAVRLILASKGKVILTGLGKSGHIARKIAATLASTGTASFFMHPSEALHGDSGVLEKNDTLIAIGFNGETREVVEIAKFARRVGSPVIAITGNSKSSLANLSDLVLNGAVKSEACPLNLAPTSSTTVALALGDALAVALMKARGFRDVDFARYHPEGSLGRKLSVVSQHMIPAEQITSLLLEDSFHKVLERVTQNNYGISAVLSADGALIGAVTDGDLRRAIVKHEARVFNLQARDIMTTKPKVTYAHNLAVDALRAMESQKITALFVVNSPERPLLEGLVRMHDLLAAKII